ncbi:helix-turn-helix transcriptional regulator [Candidatus Stoquefichus sp. SB1]|uniref:helix-turn-helix transcriptional regulator n=1 Tax=Candidatus Stoquefichus sp. SB1 TaxID=1658109 RepID=UPI0018E38DB7|nr:helix-turn-helix transcriptional regulator [Candidatus Stoquefichus sp. SB1]
MPSNVMIGERLRNLRLKKGITQSKVAQSIGVSLSAITNYELGVRIPRDEVKIKLASFYGLTVEEIFFN